MNSHAKEINQYLRSLKPDWNVNLPHFNQFTIDKETQIFLVPPSNDALVYCELVFVNGRISEKKKMASRLTANQLFEGCIGMESKELADFFDFYGVNYSMQADLDFSSLSFSCLHKHLAQVVEMMVRVLTEPSFSEENLEKGKKAIRSQLKHQLTEPDFVSYREFTARVYGPQSMYGYNSSVEFLEALTVEDLKTYHKENYTAKNLKVFYSGKMMPQGSKDYWTTVLKPFFSIEDTRGQFRYQMEVGIHSDHHYYIPSSTQVSLKMGRRMFERSHPDFYHSYLTNTILGDYFGSRLMKSIREDYGLTYDIHSTLDSQAWDGCFYISAEINAGSKIQTIEKIHSELNKLRTEPISSKELNTVKNYLLGHILRLMDGSIQTAILIKILVLEYKGVSAFRQLLSAIETATPEDILRISNQYLNPAEFFTITAGAGKSA